MVNKNIKKLKKYLFLISILFFFITFSHLMYNYLYSWAKMVPVKWGTISEWLIWKFPSLNPLLETYWNNEYILNLLYRSLLKFDIKKWKIAWDIANCDISSLSNIECVINEDAKWSNGKNITSEDIISTYQLIKETKLNDKIYTLIKDTEIETKDNIITFKNKTPSIKFLDVFFQPILNKDFIDTLSSKSIKWNFWTDKWIYSWEFTLENTSYDSTLWISKITLEKNKYFSKWNLEKMYLYIFPNINSLEKNKQLINVFNDEFNSIWESIFRLESYKYTLPQFVWLFLNKENIKNTDLRTFILNKVKSENLVSLLWKANYQVINNPYLTEESLNKEPKNKNFDSIMSSLWYNKKSKLLEEISKKWNLEEDKTTQETEENKTTETPKTFEELQKDSKYIYSPDYVDLYNFVTKDNILLKWKTFENNVDAVYINDYKLQGFSKWDKEFYYRIKTSYNNFKKWINNYKIYFEKDWKKEFKEEIWFILNENKTELENDKNKFIKDLEETQKDKIKNEEIKKEKAENKEVQKEIEKEKLEKQIEEIVKLDENKYYNKDLKVFSLKLYYLNTEKYFEKTANFIKNSLKEIWIETELVPIELKELKSTLDKKEDYDMILIWVNLWYFDFNIFPFFHSGQAQEWEKYNFSNIKNTNLDSLLLELKENFYDKEKTNNLEKKVLAILKNEQVIKTLYTPKINLLIDKNIKIWEHPDRLTNTNLRTEIIENSYVKSEQIIDFENKSFLWFFKYLFTKIYE